MINCQRKRKMKSPDKIRRKRIMDMRQVRNFLQDGNFYDVIIFVRFVLELLPTETAKTPFQKQDRLDFARIRKFRRTQKFSGEWLVIRICRPLIQIIFPPHYTPAMHRLFLSFLAFAFALATAQSVSAQAPQRPKNLWTMNDSLTSLVDKKAYADAAVVFEAMTEGAKEFFSGCDTLVPVFWNYGGYVWLRTNLAKAQACFDSAATVAGRCQGALAKAHWTHKAAKYWYNKAKYRLAANKFMEAFQIRKQVLGINHADCAETRLWLGHVRSAQGDYQGARALYLEVLDIYRSLRGEKNAEYCTGLQFLAAAYQHLGQYDLAEQTDQKALNLWKSVAGQKSDAYADCLCDLAGLYKAKARYPESESLYTQCLSIREDVFGKGHERYAYSLNNLAGLYFARGEYDRAEPVYREALLVMEKTVGKTEENYAIALENLGRLLFRQDQKEEGQRLCAEALSLFKTVLGEGHPRYGRCLGRCALLDMPFAAADVQLHKALGIVEKSLGKVNPDYAELVYLRGLLLVDEKRYDAANGLFQEALGFQCQCFGHNHPDIALCLYGLGRGFCALNEASKAKQSLADALRMVKSFFADSHPDVRRIQQAQASCL